MELNEGPQPNENENTITLSPAQTEALQWFFKYDSIFMELEAALRGRHLKWNDKAQQWQIDLSGAAKPVMNEEGIQETMGMIRGVISQVEAFTVFDKPEILGKCKEMNNVLVRFYAVNMKRFELTPEKASFVIRMIMGKYHANLCKSLNGASMELTRGTFRSSSVKQEMVRPSGLLGMLPGFRR